MQQNHILISWLDLVQFSKKVTKRNVHFKPAPNNNHSN